MAQEGHYLVRAEAESHARGPRRLKTRRKNGLSLAITSDEKFAVKIVGRGKFESIDLLTNSKFSTFNGNRLCRQRGV